MIMVDMLDDNDDLQVTDNTSSTVSDSEEEIITDAATIDNNDSSNSDSEVVDISGAIDKDSQMNFVQMVRYSAGNVGTTSSNLVPVDPPKTKKSKTSTTKKKQKTATPLNLDDKVEAMNQVIEQTEEDRKKHEETIAESKTITEAIKSAIEAEEARKNSSDDNDTDDIINYEDEELADEYINKDLMPMELNTIDQIKLFLTDSKNFFTSSFIESMAAAALSSSNLIDPKIQKTVTDSIIIFSQICKKFDTIEKEYGQLFSRTMIDDIIIDSLHAISDQILESKPYSPYIARTIFSTISKGPTFFGTVNLETDDTKRFNKILTTDINMDITFAQNLQREVESKIKILDIIKCVQSYSKFLSRDASKCIDIDDFIKSFSGIINDASSSISEVLEDDNTGITISDVLKQSFFDTVVRTKDMHMKTGLAAFDSITNGGFERDRVYLLAGKTGGGKSTVLLNLAYGMYKAGNGLFFPEVYLFDRLMESDLNIESFKAYHMVNVDAMIKEDIKRNGVEIGNKKHLILYVTLENTEYETIKRFMCRMGLFSQIFWLLIEKDEHMKALVKEKGFDFGIQDLPAIMPLPLKRRICAIAAYINTICSYTRTDFKIWWRPPYTISTYDIFMEVKKLERDGYIVDAVYVDYPDKMRPIDKDISKSDQTWDTLGKIIDNLKGFSKQAAVPVLAVSQLTRQGNKDSGNKNVIIKGGATAGSQQKESNTDFLINMNIHSKDDSELNIRIDMFKNYQRYINQSKGSVVNNLFNNINSTNSMNLDDKIKYFRSISKQAEDASDILQLAFCMPDIQGINNYIVKNRDGISDMVFDTYVVYGIYLVTDYDQEAIDSARFCGNTFMEIIRYLKLANLINEYAEQACNGLYDWFNRKLTSMQYDLNDQTKNTNGQPINIPTSMRARVGPAFNQPSVPPLPMNPQAQIYQQPLQSQPMPPTALPPF